MPILKFWLYFNLEIGKEKDQSLICTPCELKWEEASKETCEFLKFKYKLMKSWSKVLTLGMERRKRRLWEGFGRRLGGSEVGVGFQDVTPI